MQSVLSPRAGVAVMVLVELAPVKYSFVQYFGGVELKIFSTFIIERVTADGGALSSGD